ncbi:Gfo/Idh/MocA family oxidoreductase [Paenibacillus aurantius]|uniref:Gfo/Idh/MocA family oxidoreductase n=1 Tax=Paenibacillus aurantius TaxID=2918900 RepID=A0AA96LEV6_9BACL|nr:Gfo/Idh/MocA family oxidoreductase [Paenibacillus aurantius]WNQ12547.1 Gfo/Idh/MocA family oxidoreductase [Paenibacillus aurantius]
MKAGRFGIIGCQHPHIGNFISGMLKLGYTCAGIYEQENGELAGKLSETYGVPLVSDPESLLSSPEVEVIGCASINAEKIDVIEWCEKHGKHVMVDKPVVTTDEGLSRLKGVMDRGRIQIGMLVAGRFSPLLYSLKKRIDAGELGRLLSITTRKPHRLHPASRPAWHFSKERNGGIIIDLLIHDMDLLRYLTGREISDLEGFIAKNGFPEYPDFYDSAGVQVYMEGGIAAQLYADWYTAGSSWTWGDCRIFVTGTKGSAELRLSGDPLIAKEGLLLLVTDTQALHRVVPESPPVTILEDFMGRLQGHPALQTHEDILKASQAVIRADRQAKVINRTAPL